MKIRMILAALAVILMVGFFVAMIVQNIDMRSDPTYASAKAFMAIDETDKQQFDINTYDCHNFSKDVQYNASLSNIKCAYVLLMFEGVAPGENHAIVAFNTTDRGTIFFEPQTDDEVICIEGNDYAMPSGSFKITDITYFWEYF